MKPLFVFFILNLNLNSQNIDLEKYYSYRYEAESDIMRSDYKSAILNYNKAFQIRNLDRTSVRNYLSILQLKEEYKIPYFDTVLFYLALYNQNIELYSSVSFVKDLILANKTKKFSLKDVNNNILCNEFFGKFGRMREEYMEIINDGKAKGIHEDSVMKKEPYRSKIKELDSIQYYQFLQSIQDPKYQSCIHSIFYTYYTGSFLRYGNDTSMYDLDNVLIRLASEDKIDKTFLAVFLELCYNDSKTHLPKSAYCFTQTMMAFPDKIIYEVLNDSLKSEINAKRKKYYLEPIDITLQKIKWQLESEYRYYFSIANTNEYHYIDKKKEETAIQKFIEKHPSKKFQMDILKPKMAIY